jgi:hypothetical protein
VKNVLGERNANENKIKLTSIVPGVLGKTAKFKVQW